MTELHLDDDYSYLENMDSDEFVKLCGDGSMDDIYVAVLLGADVNTKDIYDYTPLIMAAKNCYTEAMKFLIDKGADVNAKNYIDETPFMYSAVNEDYKGMDLLLANGADINAADWRGMTALIFAVLMGSYRLVKYLVEHGADVNVKNNNGESPILIAHEELLYDIENFLEKHGAEPYEGEQVIIVFPQDQFDDIAPLLKHELDETDEKEADE